MARSGARSIITQDPKGPCAEGFPLLTLFARSPPPRRDKAFSLLYHPIAAAARRYLDDLQALGTYSHVTAPMDFVLV